MEPINLSAVDRVETNGIRLEPDGVRSLVCIVYSNTRIELKLQICFLGRRGAPNGVAYISDDGMPGL